MFGLAKTVGVFLLFPLIAAAQKREAAEPTNAKEYHDRAEARAKEGKLDEAIQDLTEAIRLDPKYATAYCSRGGALLFKGEYNAAIQDLTEAIRLDPMDAE